MSPASRLRLAILALAGAQTLYWLYALSLAMREVGNPRADGFGLIPIFFATPPFLAFTVPALAIGLFGRGALRMGLTLALIGAVLTPLVPWQMLLAYLQDALFWTPPAP